MYYHGQSKPNPEPQYQFTRVAISSNGLDFTAQSERLGNPYFRVFSWNGFTYALSMPGKFYRSRDGLTNFERGPMLFSLDMRHCALQLKTGTLRVFFTNAKDCPESILLSEIELRSDWNHWQPSEPVMILEPETDYEGIKQPLIPSQRGAVHEPVRQLRDPCVFEENDRTYLLYAVAGEQGIAAAQIIEEQV